MHQFESPADHQLPASSEPLDAVDRSVASMLVSSEPNESNESAESNERTDADQAIDRDALLVCIDPGRFVVVRNRGPQRLRPVEGGWDELCRLKPGDRVIYEGTTTVVRAIEVY